MKLPEMPELPQSHFPDPRYGMSHEPAFTADQMRSFFELGYKMGREDAAKVCDERSRDGPESMTSEAMLCAAAIRHQGEQG